MLTMEQTRLEFDGLEVAALTALSFSGTVEITHEQARRLELGKPARFVVSVIVAENAHRHKVDDSGEQAVHAFKAKVLLAEPG